MCGRPDHPDRQDWHSPQPTAPTLCRREKPLQRRGLLWQPRDARRKPGGLPVRTVRWTKAEVALLECLPDEEAARSTGGSVNAVRQKREALRRHTHGV
jgi:hypothetical protein